MVILQDHEAAVILERLIIGEKEHPEFRDVDRQGRTLAEDMQLKVDNGLGISHNHEQETSYNNYYRHCNTEWVDTWSCMCNYDCPVCGKEIEPYESVDLANQNTSNQYQVVISSGIDAAQQVVDSWEHGNLAEAIRLLEDWAVQAADYLPKEQ